MVEENKGENNGHSIGWIFTIFTIVIICIVGLAIYNTVSAPYYKHDELLDRLDNLGNVSEEYRQGWIDCADYYLWLETAPTNCTTNGDT